MIGGVVCIASDQEFQPDTHDLVRSVLSFGNDVHAEMNM